MILFDCCGNCPADTNTVTTHDKILLFAVAVLECCFKRLTVAVSQLEYVTDLNTPGQFKISAAIRAWIVFSYLPQITHL